MGQALVRSGIRDRWGTGSDYRHECCEEGINRYAADSVEGLDAEAEAKGYLESVLERAARAGEVEVKRSGLGPCDAGCLAHAG